MDFQKLYYFLVFSKSLHLSRAAEILRISAPALSKAIKLLEQDLEVKLFINEGKKFYLTQDGEKLAQKIEPLLSEVKTLKAQFNIKNKTQSEVKIATSDLFSTYFLSTLQTLHLKEFKLSIIGASPDNLEQLVLNQEVDFAITNLPQSHKDLDLLKIKSIEMGVYTNSFAFENLSQKDLPYVAQVSYLNQKQNKKISIDGWPEDAYQRKIIYEVNLQESALELCRQGLAAGYFPLFIVNAHNDQVKEKYKLIRRKSPYDNRTCKTDVYIVKRKSKEEDQSIKQIAKAIRKFC